jgi:hypothetical protein
MRRLRADSDLRNGAAVWVSSIGVDRNPAGQCPAEMLKRQAVSRFMIAVSVSSQE